MYIKFSDYFSIKRKKPQIFMLQSWKFTPTSSPVKAYQLFSRGGKSQSLKSL